MLIEILTFSFMKMRLNVSSAKWRPFCLGLNVLKHTHILHVTMLLYDMVGPMVCISSSMLFNGALQIGLMITQGKGDVSKGGN